MSIILGGYKLDANMKRHQIEVISDPDDPTLEGILLGMRESDGVIGMKILPAPEIGPYELMIHADDGSFLLMLNEIDDDGDINVRTLSEAESGLKTILGENYPAAAVTRDIKLACFIFKEFARTGNVSIEYLS